MRHKWIYASHRAAEDADDVVQAALRELKWRGGGFLIPIELPSPTARKRRGEGRVKRVVKMSIEGGLGEDDLHELLTQAIREVNGKAKGGSEHVGRE